MATPGAFELGRAIGTNVSQGVTQASEQNYLDKVLTEIGQSNDPTQIQNSIGQILSHVSPERQPLAQAVIQNKLSLLQKQRTQQATQAAGMPAGFENLPPTVQAAYIRNKTQASKNVEPDRKMLNYAFDKINKLVSEGHTGPSLKSFSAKGREARAELNNLGEVFIANLIPLINPRGTMSRERFNYIKSLAPTGFDTDATIKGKLNALKEMFSLGEESISKMESMPEDQFNAFFSKSTNLNDPISKQENASSEFSDAMLLEALKQSNNDPVKAQEILLKSKR